MALTVRREGTSDSGTLSRPVPLALNLSQLEPPAIECRQWLGYEGRPSTAVYGINSGRHFELRLSRDGTDRYAVHIQVTVIDAAGQAVYQITTASGAGDWQVMPAGQYRIVAALLIPEEVELGLRIEARPVRTRLMGIAIGTGGGQLRTAEGATAFAEGGCPSLAVATQPVLEGSAEGLGSSLVTLLDVRGSSLRCRCVAAGSGSAAASAAAMQWVDQYGRPLGAAIVVVPVALDQPELVQGSDWAVTVQLLNTITQLPRDLTGMTFAAEIWDLERAYRYATCAVVVASLSGGPITASLTPEQTALVGDYEGQQVLFELTATGDGVLAYLLEGLVTVRLGASQPL